MNQMAKVSREGTESFANMQKELSSAQKNQQDEQGFKTQMAALLQNGSAVSSGANSNLSQIAYKYSSGFQELTSASPDNSSTGTPDLTSLDKFSDEFKTGIKGVQNISLVNAMTEIAVKSRNDFLKDMKDNLAVLPKNIESRDLCR